ncbi:MAG: hypothetical protein AMJ46_13735 [Latescibacteria bacterium DG_63]|nr:MAG: hypothetical protein AMJ46_13735 [Latescibacteria bacterium DG_63]
MCIDVDSTGFVYIYDAIKGDVKVYDSEGVYAKTVKALPWIVGEQMLGDMGVGPNGDIYLAIESGRMDERIRIYKVSATDGTLEQLPTALDRDFLMKDGIPVSSSLFLTVDTFGDVYLVDRHSWNTITIVREDKVLKPEDQLASLRKGHPMKSGYWVVVRGRPTRSWDERLTAAIYDKGGREFCRFSSLRGPVVGVDAEGNAYVDVVKRKGKQLVFSTEILSPQGELVGIIDSPRIRSSTRRFGKGTRRLFAPDGSAYKLVGTHDSVRVYKWQRVSCDTVP